MSLTFKQYNTFLETSDPEQLDELFGIFKNAEEKKKAELEKLKLQAERGDTIAKMKLRDAELAAAKGKAGKKADSTSGDSKFAYAKAHAEVAAKGSSRAFDKETGSQRRGPARWDSQRKEWVNGSAWDHVGKHH